VQVDLRARSRRALRRLTDPRERIRRFAEAATAKPPSIFVQLVYEALTEPAVAAVLERTGSARQAALARSYRDLGFTPRRAARRATIAYALYVGLAVLSPDKPARQALAAELKQVLLA
jgi:hypothetical protein